MLHPPEQAPESISTPRKKPRTAEDFLRFCDVVLAYTNYPHAFYEDDMVDRKIESPLNSIGESANVSGTSDSSSQISSVCEPGEESDEDTWGMVTCWCGKPFAGRPMIECESCLVWLHLSCARVRKSNIPKNFKCARCKPKSRKMRQISESASGGLNGHNKFSPPPSTNGTSDSAHSRGNEMEIDMKPNNSSVKKASDISPSGRVEPVTKFNKSASSSSPSMVRYRGGGSGGTSPDVSPPPEIQNAARSRRRLKLLSPKVPYRGGDRKYIVFDHSEPSFGGNDNHHYHQSPRTVETSELITSSSSFISSKSEKL